MRKRGPPREACFPPSTLTTAGSIFTLPACPELSFLGSASSTAPCQPLGPRRVPSPQHTAAPPRGSLPATWLPCWPQPGSQGPSAHLPPPPPLPTTSPSQMSPLLLPHPPPRSPARPHGWWSCTRLCHRACPFPLQGSEGAPRVRPVTRYPRLGTVKSTRSVLFWGQE